MILTQVYDYNGRLLGSVGNVDFAMNPMWQPSLVAAPPAAAASYRPAAAASYAPAATASYAPSVPPTAYAPYVPPSTYAPEYR